MAHSRYMQLSEASITQSPSALLLTQSLEDLRLSERIERALRATGYGALRTINVSVQARRVHLGGCVPSYYLKQMAQATVQSVPGAQQIQNDLQVVPAP